MIIYILEFNLKLTEIKTMTSVTNFTSCRTHCKWEKIKFWKDLQDYNRFRLNAAYNAGWAAAIAAA